MIRIPKTKTGLAFYIFSIFIATFSVFATSNSPVSKHTIKAPSPIPQTAVLGASEDIVYVERVIDGDTFQIAGNKKVRMIGIDTPEVVDPRKPVQCYGKEASEYTKTLILNKQVKLVKDVSETDSFGRLLRYVYVGDQLVNKMLVENGYAHASTFPPDISKQEEFKNSEKIARVGKHGLWGAGCSK